MNNNMDPNTDDANKTNEAIYLDEAKTDESKTYENLWLTSTFNRHNQQGEWMVDRFFYTNRKI